MANTLGKANPLRYRRYIYDEETRLYYLQSRYYDPQIGRFINADDTAYLGANGDFISYNLFTYCHNNPVNMADNGGTLAFFVATGIAGAVIGGIAGYATTGTWKGALAGAVVGGAVGLAAGAGAAYLLAGKATASVGAVAIGANLQVAGLGSKGFSSFKAFKSANGVAGTGKAWHHIVGQTPTNINQFGTGTIHNANNLVKIAHGKGTIHNMITSHYNSRLPYTNGMTVHKWLESKSFRFQYNYGLELLSKLAKEVGAVIEYAS